LFRYFYILLFIFVSIIDAKNFTVASYNVQNLFDLKTDGTEYKEYNPKQNKRWNKKALDIKLNNISKVIKDLDATIIALQEIESKQAFRNLKSKLPRYKYSAFLKNNDTAIGVAILSKVPILNISKIDINAIQTYSRPILKVKLQIQNKQFIIYINHWRSKKAPESYRVEYATSLKQDIKKLPANSDYIIVGDFNSNYNENETIIYEKELNDTYGITAINDILQKPLKLINLWYELPYHSRFSYKYKGEKTTPDSIILSKNLFDKYGISYLDDSFKVYKPYYLYKNNKIQSWNFTHISNNSKLKGFSDHLPIIATFTTKPFVKNKAKSAKKYTIKDLYSIEKLDKPIELKNVVVLYKYKKSAILKQKNNRAIWAYNCASNLNIGDVYDITISKISRFNGLKEIKTIDFFRKINQHIDIKQYILNPYKIDLFDKKYQNELIVNLKAIYKKGYLYFGKNKIKLYTKNKKLLIKDGQKVIIHNAHLSNFRSKVQLAIYKQSDIDVI
jgi:exonuclease III